MADTFDHLFSESPKKNEGEEKSGLTHMEESKSRRKTDADDREAIRQDLAKHSHPLIKPDCSLYNIVTSYKLYRLKSMLKKL